MELFLFLQIVLYSFAASYKILFRRFSGWKVVKKMTALAYYFCVGNCGTLLGVVCFLKGNKITKWEPVSNR